MPQAATSRSVLTAQHTRVKGELQVDGKLTVVVGDISTDGATPGMVRWRPRTTPMASPLFRSVPWR